MGLSSDYMEVVEDADLVWVSRPSVRVEFSHMCLHVPLPLSPEVTITVPVEAVEVISIPEEPDYLRVCLHMLLPQFPPPPLIPDSLRDLAERELLFNPVSRRVMVPDPAGVESGGMKPLGHEGLDVVAQQMARSLTSLRALAVHDA